MSPQRKATGFWRALLPLAAVLVLSVWGEATAQTTATIRGRVTDEAGDGVAEAAVVATNVNSGFTVAAATEENGNFNLAGLQPGTYTIMVTSPAYEQRTEERTVLIGQTLDLVLKLSPAEVLTEEITVVGTSFLETRTPELATNITKQQIDTLPQSDRNFLNFAALAPGVQLGNDPLRKEIKAGAQGSSATNVFIDGISFKNDVIQGGVVGQDSSRGNPFPQNAVQEFRVITQNYSAEYAKASSAIITAITRSGSNALSGDVFAYYQDKSLVDEDPLTGADPEYERLQWGLNVGGPIIQDRMHYFFSYEANDQDREETVTLGGGFQNNPGLRQSLERFTGTFVSPFRSDLGFGKLSWQPTQTQILDLSATFRSETDIRSFGGQTSREAAEDVQNDVWGMTLRHQYVASDWLNEASLAFQDFNWNPQPLNPDLVGVEYEGLLTIGGRDTEQNIGQERLALRDDVTFSGLQGAGNHDLRTGLNVEFLDYTVNKKFAENPRYFFRSDLGTAFPYRANWGFGDPDMSASNTEYGVYGQDTWRVSDRLTLNLGLRWDYESDMLDPDYVTPPEVRARLSDQFPSKFFSDGDDRSPATDLWQPRLGFSYDLMGNARTVIFGGAGRYFDRVLFNNTLDERFRLQHAVGQFFFTADGSPFQGQPAAAWDPRYFTEAGLRELQSQGITGKPEVFLIENDTEVPYSDQWNIGVRHTFGAMVAALSYASIRSYHGLSFLWGAGFCCPQFDPAYSNVLISSDDVKTWYDAVYLTFDRPYSGNYGYNVSYTYADAEQIGGDLFSLDLPVIADWPRYGTPGTQDHRIVANGIVGIPWDMRFSGILQYGSGDKFRIHDFSNGFQVGSYRPRTGEGPDWTTLDLRLEKDFVFADRHRFGIILEAFNVFNEERYLNYQDFLPPEGNPRLGEPNSIISGSQRRYQFGVRYGF